MKKRLFGVGKREKKTDTGAAWAPKKSEGAGAPGEQAEEAATELDAVGRKKRRFQLTGSMVAKVAAFILLFTSIIVGVMCAAVIYIAAEHGAYLGRKKELLTEALWSSARMVAREVRDRFDCGQEDTIEAYLQNINVEVAVLDLEDAAVQNGSAFLWRSYKKEDAKGENNFYSDFYLDYELPCTFPFRAALTTRFTKPAAEEKVYIFRVFIDPEMTEGDVIRLYYNAACFVYNMRYYMIGILAGSVLLAVICFVFLLCSAGHRNGRSGITPGVLTGLYFDLMTAVFFALYYALGKCLVVVSYHGSVEAAVQGSLILLAGGILFMIGLIDFAIRLKLGKWWKHTLTYVVLRAVCRGLRFLVMGIWSLLRELPTVLKVMTVYLGICILELFGLGAFRYREEVFILWGLEKVILFLVVLYVATACRKLLNASRELAEGREDYRVDTRYLFGALREHGENLNCLGQGISKAVAERMRSEHLKTELITNVSHDLKTPLTSIINYANLICEEKSENPKIEEYSEVLLRQSGRLKKLLENLVEASKATTGNLEVNLAPCEVGVLLTQAVGEYQQRMEEKGLELKDRQPEEPVRILADGRHLWRVFDNLLNNICKYAQENTRVYLSLERQENKVFIIFRNMSKYALDISPEELEERFVRGDKSRHMEGNGLGLSIAKSLTELQGGKLDILIDGDLFKVTLTFSALQNE